MVPYSIYCILIALGLLLASCAVGPAPEETLSASPTTPIPLPRALPTAITTQFPSVEEWCLQIIDGAPPKLNGRLVLSGFRLPSKFNQSLIEGPSYLLDLQTGQRIDLGPTRFESVAPDGRFLAFYDLTRDVISVTDQDGNRIKEIPALKRELEPRYWLDNQFLQIERRLDDPSRADDFTLLVFNPLTSEQQDWLPEFPFQIHNDYFLWRLSSNLIFNPSLSHVVYPADDGVPMIILWDMRLQQEVARVFGSFVGNTPRWSPDGARFVVSSTLRSQWGGEEYVNIDDGLPGKGGTELLLVSQTGEISRLTYLTTSKRVAEFSPVWSPDGRKIAFYFNEPLNSSPPELAIIEAETGNMINFCKMQKLPVTRDELPVPPPDAVWSPDGKYLAITQINKAFQYKVLLVELKSGYAWYIADDASVMGWIVPDQ